MIKKIFLIIVIAFLSISQILKYYFSYEDFSLLYGVQFPSDPHSIFLYPGFVAYLFLRPLVTIEYFFFGYNPFFYYLASFILFLLFLVLFYLFMRILYTKRKEISVYAAAIAASGYLGIESLTWNVAGGQIHLVFLISSLLTLILLINYLKHRSKFNLIFFAASLLFSLYFFQFRSFLLLIWIPLLILSQTYQTGKRISWRPFLPMVILFILPVIIFFQSFKLIFGKITHLNISWEMLDVFVKNLGNVLFPSDLLLIFSKLPESIETIFGFLALLVLILPLLHLWREKKKLFWIAFFFSLIIFLSLAVIMLVISFVGQIPTIWPSSHRFYIVLLPFVSGYLAIILSILRKKLQLLVFFIILLFHIYFSNYVINNRWESHSSHLKYFYETITTKAPHIDRDSVLLTTLTRPYPPGPYVSGSDAGSAHFLAGFYSKRFDDFHLATDPLEAVRLLQHNNLGPNDIYAFDYKRGDILEETPEARKILSAGQKVNLGSNLDGKEIELTDLDIPASTPVFIKAWMRVDLTKEIAPKLFLQGGSMSLDQYFDLFFNQEAKRAKMITADVSSMSDEHNINNVIDGKNVTTWIPSQWESEGTKVTIDLGDLTKVYKIVWASSRTAPWEFRAPSEYEISISQDGKEFITVEHVTNAPRLTTGQFFTTEVGGKEAKYIRLIIKKTRGGWTPAVDEIEIFDKPLEKKDLENYFLVRNNPAAYFPNWETMLRFYKQILKEKIPVEINWRVDGDGGYPAGQEQKIYIKGLSSFNEYTIQLPKTGRRIKSIKINVADFPSNLKISKIEAWHPSLKEFNKDKSLLNAE
ncbi:discoidin domain-containing protein [Candidatus Microgenomates bacterium]|nr:discoidin domain-containing protein [Candidatus Microgenomates bacterium]